MVDIIKRFQLPYIKILDLNPYGGGFVQKSFFNNTELGLILDTLSKTNTAIDELFAYYYEDEQRLL